MRYFNRDGEPINSLVWARLLRDPKYATVKAVRREVCEVVTSWVGVAADWETVPQIFLVESRQLVRSVVDGKEQRDMEPLRDPTWCTTEQLALAEHRKREKEIRCYPTDKPS